jgi:glutathione S-transferase
MITVHHLEHSRSQRVLWLLEELGLRHGRDYTVRRYARDPKTMLATPELKAVHPLGKSPVLTDDTDGSVVAESGAIVEWLCDRFDGAQRMRPPPGSPERLRFTYWLHFAEGSAMPPLLMKLVFDKVRAAPVPFFVKPVVKAIADKVTQGFIAPNIAAQLDFMQAELAQRPWFAGPAFSAADVQMSFPLEAADARAAGPGGLGASHPALAAWLQRIHQRPAYARALEVGGPYRILD